MALQSWALEVYAELGYFTYDPGFMLPAPVVNITFIDG